MFSKEDRHGLRLIAGVLLVLLVLVVWKAVVEGGPKMGPDNCLPSVVENTVVVLDQSERVTSQTADEVVARALKYVHENVRDYERVSVFTITDLSRRELTPVFSRCRPPEDGNRIYQSVSGIRKRYLQGFEEPLRAALVLPGRNGVESPIAEVLTDISLSQYLAGTRNALVVFSDLIEHTPTFSLYRCTAPDSVIARFRRARQGAMERPRFKNTMVSLNLIPRLGLSATTAQCRDVLWTWFFGDDDGPQAGLSFDYLPGGTPLTDAAPGEGP